MRTFTLIAFVCLSFAPILLNAQVDREYVLRAIDYQEERDFESAVVYYTRAIDWGGEMAALPEVYLERGTCFFRLKQYRQALKDLDFGLSLDNSNHVLYMQRAMVFYSLLKPEYAIEDFVEALKLVDNDSTEVAIRLNLGSARMMHRDFEGAHGEFSIILNHDSTHVAALTNMGVALNNLGRPGEAIQYLKRAVAANPKDPASHINIGFHFLRREAYKDAIPHFDKAIELKPGAALAYNNRGYAKLMTGNTLEALNDVNKSLRLFPTNAYAYRNRALIFFDLEKNEQACEDLQLAIDHKFTQQYGNEVQQLLSTKCE
ncbi:MAG: tetratricopeptide repeat protein [Bacteroidota bacterium]